MSRHDWYRSTAWDPQIAEAFEARLARARSKEQYLRIQASHLTTSHPDTALALLDRYFALPDQLDAAHAHVDQATAFLTQGRLQEALEALKAALAREQAFPNLRTLAYVEFPLLVATHGIKPEYPNAREVLAASKERPVFPAERFKWNAASALLLIEGGDHEAARPFASAAVAAAELWPGFTGPRPELGHVPDDCAELLARMRAVCAC